MKKGIILVLVFLCSLAHASPRGWVTEDGQPIPNSDQVKSINGFGGWLVVTPDADWEAKWNTSPETIPRFTEAKDVSFGEALTILAFYINPKTNDSGEVDVRCGIKVTRPDGTSSVDEADIPCASGKLQGDPGYVRLSSAVVQFVGEEGDPPGEWVVEVSLTDKVRGTTLPLRARFRLLDLLKT